MKKSLAIILIINCFLCMAQKEKKPELKIFFEQKITNNKDSLVVLYKSLNIKSKYERNFSVSIFYRSDAEIRISEEFEKKNISINLLRNTSLFCDEIAKNNFRKENSYKFSKTKFNRLNDSFFEEDEANINKILKDSKGNSRKNDPPTKIIFYFPIEHCDIQLKKVPTEVKKSPLLEFEMELNSMKSIYINCWNENFDGENWIENEKNTMLLNPGINKWSKEISTDSTRIAFEFQNDLDSSCMKSIFSNIIRYKFKNEVKPVCLEENFGKKYFFLELDKDDVKCGAEKLILRNALTDNYDFLLEKQNGVSKYFAVFEDLCNPEAGEVEIELMIDESFNDEKFMVLYIPMEALYKYDLFERVINNNIYTKELLMTLKLVINAQKAFMKIPTFCKEKISWQRCN